MGIIDRWRQAERRFRDYGWGIIMLGHTVPPELRKKAWKVLRLTFDGTRIYEFSADFDSKSVMMDDTRYDFDGHLV